MSESGPEDIVDHLSEATGYFHDSEAAKLRDIAEACGQKPVGIVRSAVEAEIEDREWRIAHFEHSDDAKYPTHFAPEYYQIHKQIQIQLENAISELSEEDAVYGEQPKEEFEAACDTLEERARVHRAKADKAERYLEENNIDPEEVLMA